MNATPNMLRRLLAGTDATHWRIATRYSFEGKWCATEEPIAADGPIGYGATEAAAIADLLRQTVGTRAEHAEASS